MNATDTATEASWGFENGDEIAPGLHALRALGGGYRYEVYLAWDDERLTSVAAKLLRPDRVEDGRAVREIEAEARALRALDHPVLPRCFGAVPDGERPLILLEFLEGPRLSTLLRRHGPLAVEQALPLTLQLCAAVHFMAVRGFVHLDVKPKNIVMGAPARLIDLSIALTREEAARAIGPLGTDAYMAPEQCGVPDAGSMGPPADVWGIGVTLYESVTGRLPFSRGVDHARAPEERFPQLVEQPSPLPKEIPPVLAEPILSCLHKRPDDRPTARALAEALQPLVDSLPRRPVIARFRPGGRRR